MAGSSRSHKPLENWTLGQLSAQFQLYLQAGQPDQSVARVSSVASATQGALVLITHKKYVSDLKGIKNLICLTSAELVAEIEHQLDAPSILVAQRPRSAFGRILSALFPEDRPEPAIDASATIHPKTAIDPSATICAHVVIGPNCQIGADCVIGAGSVLTQDVQLKAGCRIGPLNVLSFLRAGEGLKTDAHCVIGKRGFGFEGQGADAQFLPHIGQVVMGKGCDIGAGTTIDRGMLDDTVIGDYVMIDNQCHIAHNVRIDDNAIILGQTGLAGSSHIGKGCILGGQVGVADHVKIADNVTVASKSGVTKDLLQAGNYAGFPAMPAREFWLQLARLRRTDKS